MVRRNELVDVPDRFDIHPDFLHHLSRGEFENAFRQIHEMFYMIYTDMAKVRSEKKIKKGNLLLKAFSDYGFVFNGVKNFNLSSVQHMEIDYPDNRTVSEVLYLVADKVMNTQLRGIKNHLSDRIAFSNAFIGWNYKILSEPVDICTVAAGCDYVADKMHSEAGT